MIGKSLLAATIALAFCVSALAGPADDKALLDASLALDLDEVKAALEKGADPNTRSNTARRMSPLDMLALGILGERPKNATASEASKAGFSDHEIKNHFAVEIAKLLFASGAKLSASEREILFFPIASGNVELVQLFLDKGASVTANLEGYTPTQLAKKYGQETIYNLLVSRGGVPVESGDAAQITLVEAARNSDIVRIENAIKSGARINSPDHTRTTALIAAMRYGVSEPSQSAAILWLLDHGADPNLSGKSGFSDVEGLPLHLIVAMTGSNEPPDVKRRAEEILFRLLKAGARVSGMDSKGRTPLHIAARFDNVAAAKILLKEGAKVMPRDAMGKTPFDYAESASMIKLLKDNGATER